MRTERKKLVRGLGGKERDIHPIALEQDSEKEKKRRASHRSGILDKQD